MENKYGFNGDVWFDLETGETKSKSKIRQEQDGKVLKDFNKYVSESVEIGLDNSFDLKRKGRNESTTRKVKENYQFNMIHIGDVMAIAKLKILSPKEWAFVGVFSPFVQFPDNDLKVDNQYLTLEELGEILGYGRNTMGSILKSLEEKEIIKVIKGGNKPPIIYFNPFLYASGREIKNETCDMFIDSQYNPFQKKRVKNKEGK